jgi:hypothetical protein
MRLEIIKLCNAEVKNEDIVYEIAMGLVRAMRKRS